MKIAVFDVHAYERPYLESAAQEVGHTCEYIPARLSARTAQLAAGYPAVCCFVNDRVDASVLEALAKAGTKLIALRSAGFNNVDVKAAARLGVKVVRVPEYSPHAVAEHATALILSLNRKTHRSYNRVREGNFALDGLVGFDLFGKTVGVVGLGRIGRAFVGIMKGFGCRVLAYDRQPDRAVAGVEWVDLDRLLRESDIVSLHVPLTPETRHIVDREAFAKMKTGVMLINTGRGALIDTQALIQSLKSGKVGSAGLDVYEEEEGVFFEDLSGQVLQDDVLARLLTFPNVVMTSHQGFLTHEALTAIARTTCFNVTQFERGERLANEVSV